MKKYILYLVISACFLACSPATQITDSWKSEQQIGTISSVMVTAMTGKTSTRQMIEAELAGLLQQKGLKAIKSLEVIPPTFTEGSDPNKEALLKRIRGTNVDAILTVTLIDTEKQERYVEGSYGYRPVTRLANFGRFWGYYTAWQPVVNSPGYYTEDKVYYYEINLYDAQSEELIWSAQSETYNPASLSKFTEEFASAVLAKMQKDGVLSRG